jgi:hypothetical protein
VKIPGIKKRYIILIISIAYIIGKIYVIYTPNQNDDNLPDNFRTLALRVFAINDILGYQLDKKDS